MKISVPRNGAELEALHIMEQRVKDGKMSKETYQRILLELYAPLIKRPPTQEREEAC